MPRTGSYRLKRLQRRADLVEAVTEAAGGVHGREADVKPLDLSRASLIALREMLIDGGDGEDPLPTPPRIGELCLQFEAMDLEKMRVALSVMNSIYSWAQVAQESPKPKAEPRRRKIRS